jgi:hypothetical protein
MFEFVKRIDTNMSTVVVRVQALRYVPHNEVTRLEAASVA